MISIQRVTAAERDRVVAAARLFDHPLNEAAVDRFLGSSDHHLLIASDDGAPAGFVTGVELTHPDKGTEMFVYELGVVDGQRRQGIGTALVAALRDLAVTRGCNGMWVLTDAANDAALATYHAAGATEHESAELLSWEFSDAST